MFNTTLDILNFVLAVGFGLLILALVYFIYNLTRTLKLIRSLGKQAAILMDSFESYNKMPAKVLLGLIERVEKMVEKKEKRRKKE